MSKLTLTREYKKVPKHIKDDNVFPSVSEIPSFLTAMRHPGRSRATSIGPQSEADAYETLAYRDKRRRDSLSSVGPTSPRSANNWNDMEGYFTFPASNTRSSTLPTLALSPIAKSEMNGQLMSTGVLFAPLDPSSGDGVGMRRSASADRRQDEWEEREMFSKLEKPRVRYDVEVVTKLIVYAGKTYPRDASS